MYAERFVWVAKNFMSITEIQMKIRESGAKASRKHRESESFHFQSLRPALPGPEMCDSTATSTTSVPTPAAQPAPVVADKPSITGLH